MLGQEKGTKAIDLESPQAMVVTNLRGRLLWMKNARDAKGETEVAG